VTVLYAALEWLAPAWRGRLAAPPAVGFAASFVAVDYAYYWNHRLLHGATLWRWHAVHHTAAALDVLVTSRNTVWSHFLILYVWVNALGIYLLADPAPFLLGAALTAALDLWRHSEAGPPPGRLARGLAGVLITPAEHAWHHSAARPGCNFGANLSWWDRLHGTYHRPGRAPAALGLPLGWTLRERLLWPRREAARG
jgi:sterol desaturase/sphingolipid hydroxylase (fatty acid hydroxylase superfamily)